MPLIVKSVDEDLIKEVSADTGMPYGVVKDIIINGQSAFTKHTIESGGYNSVRWPKLGTFKLKTKYMLVRRHLSGMSLIHRKIFKKKLTDGGVFTKKEHK